MKSGTTLLTRTPSFLVIRVGNEKSILTIDKIVGRRISAVYQEPYREYDDEFGEGAEAEVYVELDDGTIFPFDHPDWPIERLTPADLTSRNAMQLPTAENGAKIIGQRIASVCKCPFWPSFALVLDNGMAFRYGDMAEMQGGPVAEILTSDIAKHLVSL